MNLVSASALALPVMTGLTAAFYAWLVASSAGGMWLAIAGNLISQLIVLAVLGASGVSLPRLSANVILIFAVMTVTYAIISMLWLYPLIRGMPFTVLSLTEIAWPIFAVIFGWMIFGGEMLDGWRLAGGALVICGSLLVVSGGGHG